MPDLPPRPAAAPKEAGPESKPLSPLAGDRRLVKLIIFSLFALLLLLGIAAAVLERVAPRRERTGEESAPAGFDPGTIETRPNRIVFGFFRDDNSNGQFDHREQPFTRVSVAIRRQGETEPFRRVAAGTDGRAEIDDLAAGRYQVSFDNYATPDPGGRWQWFEEYQRGGEFLPTAWETVELEEAGFKQLVGITVYRPPLVLALAADSGLVWYDPQRARVFARSGFKAGFIMRGNDVFYLEEGKLKHLNWRERALTEDLIWLEQAAAGRWWLSPSGQTVAYLDESGQMHWRSAADTCREGSLLIDGVRPEVKSVSFTEETAWLVIARLGPETPWQLFRLNCGRAETEATVSEPAAAGVLDKGWFYSTAAATYLAEADGQTVKYEALGGGTGVIAAGRYLLKTIGEGQWLVVDFPAVAAEGVEKHYRLTGISGDPLIAGDSVYYVKGKPCAADGDCGEVVKISLMGNGIWQESGRWDLKNVAADQVLGVVN